MKVGYKVIVKQTVTNKMYWDMNDIDSKIDEKRPELIGPQIYKVAAIQTVYLLIENNVRGFHLIQLQGQPQQWYDSDLFEIYDDLSYTPHDSKYD